MYRVTFVALAQDIRQPCAPTDIFAASRTAVIIFAAMRVRSAGEMATAIEVISSGLRVNGQRFRRSPTNAVWQDSLSALLQMLNWEPLERNP